MGAYSRVMATLSVWGKIGMRCNFLNPLMLAVVAGPSLAGPIQLSATMTVDNGFTASISTDANTAGTTFLTGSSWPTTYVGSFNFTAPGTYYLHILAQDSGRPAMFIGSFALSSTDATFSNGTQQLLTDASTGDWAASLTGFGGADVGVQDLGANGTSPWGTFASMGAARFIWANGNPTPLTAYFTTVITVVPAPASLGGLALGGLVAMRRRH